jgi:hypothetical protein
VKRTSPKTLREKSATAKWQDTLRVKRKAAGLVQCLVWAPAERCPELKRAADMMREHPHLVVAMMRDTVSGRLVPVK